MVTTDYGISGAALLAFAASGIPPTWCAIGSGSGTELVTQSGLLGEYTNLRKSFTSRDVSTQKECEWIFDYGAATLSGTTLTEFGMHSTATGGTIWDRHTLGSIAFDGAVEVQIQINGKMS